jgi:hypothetical protein
METHACDGDIILRYTTPTRYDKASYGAVCKILREGEKHEYYIQVSHDNIENSEWMRVGDFLEIAFRKAINDRIFIDDCLKLYEEK